jgi:hypothetical protein
VSEVHIYLGDVCMGNGKDDDGEAHYREAHAACLAAHELCPKLVSEELLLEVQAMLNAEDSETEDEDDAE